MGSRILAAALALAFAATAATAETPQTPPKLIVAISVDQFSADLFAQYRPHFTGGLRRLSEGVAFPSGYQSHAGTETCPGHATLLTGARPSRSGVIANHWFNLAAGREDKYVYCAEDERVPGSSSENYTASPFHLRVPTLGDLMRQRDPRSRSVAVSGKDRAAIMMGGHNPDRRWWWKNGGFISHAGVAPSPAVIAANARATQTIATTRSPMPLPALCEARSRPVAVGSRTVGDGRFARGAGDLDRFMTSPEWDEAVLGLAGAMRSEMRLGEGPATDILAIGLSATDYVGHQLGTQGSEMCLQLLALDRMLGGFFEELDRTGIDYVVMLTADHGGADLPERIREEAGGDAQRGDPALRVRLVSDAIGQPLGLAGPVLHGDSLFGDIYAEPSLSDADRRRVLYEAIRFYRAHPQVAAVFTREEIEATPSPSGPPDAWPMLQRARASFDPERSGDIVVILKPRVVPIPEPRNSVTTHASGWDYDRRVPILFWRRGMTPFEQPLAVETVDIMPSLAALIGLPVAPGSIDGRCLDLIAGPETSCPQ